MRTDAERSDASWLAELGATGPAREAAVGALRARLIAGLARALAGPARAQIDDFAQDAVVRILGRLDDFRGDSSFVGWATAIAVRVAFSELRRARWRDVSLDDLVASTGARADVAVAPVAPSALDRRAVYAALTAAIEVALTARQRTVIVAELRGMPQAELAARLGVTRNALYKLGHDGRRALARELAARGFDAPAVRELLDRPGEMS